MYYSEWLQMIQRHKEFSKIKDLKIDNMVKAWMSQKYEVSVERCLNQKSLISQR